MNIDISNIVKTDGASLDLSFDIPSDDLNAVGIDFKFEDTINFSGRLDNVSGIMKFSGHLKICYTVLCYRCLKEIEGCLKLNINENFISVENAEDTEAYTYAGKSLEISKALVDNIILNLPMKKVCETGCKGLCQRCGTNLNDRICGCKDDDINPKMESLKNFFNNESEG